MKTITLKSPDGKRTFQLIVYRANETVQVFKGATGEFNSEKKSAGLIYVTKGGGISADDHHVDDAGTWDWIEKWMQIGLNAEALEALYVAASKVKALTQKNYPFRSPEWAYDLRNDSKIQAAMNDLLDAIKTCDQAKGVVSEVDKSLD